MGPLNFFTASFSVAEEHIIFSLNAFNTTAEGKDSSFGMNNSVDHATIRWRASDIEHSGASYPSCDEQ